MTDAEIPQPKDDAGHAVLAVERQHLDGQFLRIGQVAGGDFEQEQLFNENRIVGILDQGLAEVIGGGLSVALLAGGAPREVVARQAAYVFKRELGTRWGRDGQHGEYSQAGET